MTAKRNISRLVLCAAMLLLLLPWWVSSAKLRDERARQAQDDEALLQSVRPGEFFGTVMAGSFRAVIIDYLWMRTKILEERKDYYGLQATYELLARLQPRDAAILSFNATNMMDNISNRFNTPAMQYKWIARGLALYRRGVETAPDSIDLRYGIAKAFFYRLSYQRAGEMSREFRRFLRDDPDPDYLVFTDRRLRSAIREALYYISDALSRPGASERKDYVNMHDLRLNCCDTLLFEREVGLREARLDVLEARAAVLAAGDDEREARVAEEILRRRLEDLRQVEAAEVLAPLTEAEIEDISNQRDESYGVIYGTPLPYKSGILTLAGRRAAMATMLRRIDEVLDMYEQALDAQTPGEPTKMIFDKGRIDALNFDETEKLIYNNSFHITPLYIEAFLRLLDFAQIKKDAAGTEN